MWAVWGFAIVMWLFAAWSWWDARQMRLDALSEGARETHAVVAAPPPPSTTSPPAAPRLYRHLAIVVGLIAVVCCLTTLGGISPILPANELSMRIAYGSADLTVMLTIAGLLTASSIPTTTLVAAVAAFAWCNPREVAK